MWIIIVISNCQALRCSTWYEVFKSQLPELDEDFSILTFGAECCGAYSEHHRMLSSIPGLRTLDASNTWPHLGCDNHKCLHTSTNIAWETKSHLAENHCSIRWGLFYLFTVLSCRLNKARAVTSCLETRGHLTPWLVNKVSSTLPHILWEGQCPPQDFRKFLRVNIQFPAPVFCYWKHHWCHYSCLCILSGPWSIRWTLFLNCLKILLKQRQLSTSGLFLEVHSNHSPVSQMTWVSVLAIPQLTHRAKVLLPTKPLISVPQTLFLGFPSLAPLGLLCLVPLLSAQAWGPVSITRITITFCSLWRTKLMGKVSSPPSPKLWHLLQTRRDAR